MPMLYYLLKYRINLYIFPQHTSKHWEKAGFKFRFHFVDVLDLKVLQLGFYLFLCRSQKILSTEKKMWGDKAKKKGDVTYGKVWLPILGISALHLPIQSAHTQQWTHTHREHTPGAVGSHMLRRPGSSWVLKVEQPLDYESNSLTIRPRLPVQQTTPCKNLLNLYRNTTGKLGECKCCWSWLYLCAPCSYPCKVAWMGGEFLPKTES